MGRDWCKAMACPRNLEEGRDGSETQTGLVGITRSSIDPMMIQHWIQYDPVARPEKPRATPKMGLVQAGESRSDGTREDQG